jgi:hypothetical protein
LLARSPVMGTWHFMPIYLLSLIALSIAGVIE